jgi:hypothetical protein
VLKGICISSAHPIVFHCSLLGIPEKLAAGRFCRPLRFLQPEFVSQFIHFFDKLKTSNVRYLTGLIQIFASLCRNQIIGGSAAGMLPKLRPVCRAVGVNLCGGFF